MIVKILEVEPSTIESAHDLLPHLEGVAEHVGDLITRLEHSGQPIDMETSDNFNPARITSRRVMFPEHRLPGSEISLQPVARIDAAGNAMLANTPVWNRHYETELFVELNIPGKNLLEYLRNTPPSLWNVTDNAFAIVGREAIYPFCSYLSRPGNAATYLSVLQAMAVDLCVLAKV